MNSEFLKRLVMPGLIIQSTMMGGGYATGRELIEFFLQLGPVAGLLAMLVTMVIMSVIFAIAFEFARMFSLNDYRLFFKKLLGPAWVIFEMSWLAMMVLVLSVLGAASGEFVKSTLDMPPIWGSIFMMISVGFLVFWGSDVIEKFLACWSIVLYIAYGVLILMSLFVFGDVIGANFLTHSQPDIDAYAFLSGVEYTGYNVIVFCAALFVVRHFRCSSDAIWAGVLSGPLCMIPGILLFIAMVAHYPAVLDQPLPINYLLNQLEAPGLNFLLQIVIFGTFIETGTALLHSVNERVAEVFAEKSHEMPRFMRPAIALVIMVVAVYMAETFGIVVLIGEGYSYSTYLFLLIAVLPLSTRGIIMIITARRGHSKIDIESHVASETAN